MILSPEECGCPLLDDGVSLVNSSICSGTFLFMLLLEGYLKGRCNIATPCKNVKSVDNVDDTYDFIVVGAGSAGSVVAGRLSESGKHKVLLIEAGGQEPIGARIPSFYGAFASNKELDWAYRTVPDDGYCRNEDGNGCSWPRGKLLGGSGVFNGMMYFRGHPADYDDWVQAGAEGWSYEENLPYFFMNEGNKEIGSVVSDKYHSGSGPLPVQRFNYQGQAVYELLDAIKEAGLPVIMDLNDPTTPEGFAIAQANNDDGQRYTTARVYLKPKSERPNLSVKLNSHVTKVVMNGNRAVGVELIDENGQRITVHASKEVILSAGALNTPQILMLSGIGPRQTLENLGIPVIADLPAGMNLRNHLGVTLYFVLNEVNNTRTLDWSTLTSYLLSQEGPMTSTSITQVSGTLYSSLADRGREQTDIQFFFTGFDASCSETGVIGEQIDCLQTGYSVSASAAALLPRSVGYLTLNSTDPLDPPLFYPRFFSHHEDMVMIKDGIRYLKKIFDTKKLQDYGIELDRSMTSSCDYAGQEWSDDWMECIVRYLTDPQNHQLGTAAIGAVVDTELRVYNISGLRVIDASVMPTQTTGNPQAAIMMVAERGAAIINELYK